MSVKVTIDGTTYPGVNTIEVGGKHLAVESEAATPIGTKLITTNGIHDVSAYASADVSVPPTGGDMPAFLSEYHAQEFVPEADTNEDVNFTYDLSGVPELIMVISDMDIEAAIEEGIRTMVSMTAWLYDVDNTKEQPNIYTGSFISVTTVVGAYSISSNASTPDAVCGPLNVTDSGFDIRTTNFGGTRVFWRAGHKYRIVAARVKRGD